MYIFYYETPIGKIGIQDNGKAITHIYFENEKALNNPILKETKLIEDANRQLTMYFDGKLKVFNLPIDPYGTEFQKRVWKSLQKISYGKTASYKEIAIDVGCPKGPRAVGLANNKNPIPLIIPCHRVIGANGSLVGFGGGLHIKKLLLDLEKVNE